MWSLTHTDTLRQLYPENHRRRSLKDPPAADDERLDTQPPPDALLFLRFMLSGETTLTSPEERQGAREGSGGRGACWQMVRLAHMRFPFAVISVSKSKSNQELAVGAELLGINICVAGMDFGRCFALFPFLFCENSKDVCVVKALPTCPVGIITCEIYSPADPHNGACVGFSPSTGAALYNQGFDSAFMSLSENK